MNKRMKIFIPIIAIGAVLFIGYEGFGWKDNVQAVISSLSKGDLLKNEPKINQQSQAVINENWQVLEEYMAAVKAHDYERVKNLTHQLSETCLDETKREECYGMMDSVYSILAQLKKDMFTHALWDNTKITLFTDNLGGARIGLYFRRNAQGEPKIAGMKLCQVTGASITSDECSILQP